MPNTNPDLEDTPTTIVTRHSTARRRVVSENIIMGHGAITQWHKLYRTLHAIWTRWLLSLMGKSHLKLNTLTLVRFSLRE